MTDPARCFVYFAAVVDWFSRKILGCELSIALAEDCLASTCRRRRSVTKNDRWPNIFNMEHGRATDPTRS